MVGHHESATVRLAIYVGKSIDRKREVHAQPHDRPAPFGVKAVAEIPMDGVAPAVGNAIYDAVGINIDENPTTPERVWRSMRVS
jgi:putative selenate reductase molybdopterin-binding subunit